MDLLRLSNVLGVVWFCWFRLSIFVQVGPGLIVLLSLPLLSGSFSRSCQWLVFRFVVLAWLIFRFFVFCNRALLLTSRLLSLGFFFIFFVLFPSSPPFPDAFFSPFRTFHSFSPPRCLFSQYHVGSLSVLPCFQLRLCPCLPAFFLPPADVLGFNSSCSFVFGVFAVSFTLSATLSLA